jgi:predicted nucleic acid-binding protein
VRFWDSSALVPLLVTEVASKVVLQELEQDPEVLTWWATEVECASAVCRLEREGVLSPDGLAQAIARLNELVRSWQIVQPVPRLRAVAVRLLRTHPLRAADALQLAAALEAAEQEPHTLPLITLDERLARAAAREGFPVLNLDAA